MSLGELRESVSVDELALHVADGRRSGPWWEERADYHAAQLHRAAVAAAGSPAGELADHLIGWGDDDVFLLDPAAGLLALRGLTS